MNSLKHVLKWTVVVILGAFLVLVVVRIFHFNNVDATNAAVAKIHATKLTLDDVMGKNLPEDPKELSDKTIAGVDANQNGIRDDVELAIFKQYPNSAKTRAVLLQYALVLQMQMTLPTVNKETFTAAIEDKDRALNCIWSISSRSDINKFSRETDANENFVTLRQFNTEQRKTYQHDLYKNLGSYSSPNEGCDIDLLTLPN